MEIYDICSHISDIKDVIHISKCCRSFHEQLVVYIQKYKSSWYFIKSIDTYYVHDMIYIIEKHLHKKLFIQKDISNFNNKLITHINKLLDENDRVVLEYTWSVAYPTNDQLFLHMNQLLKPDFRIFI